MKFKAIVVSSMLIACPDHSTIFNFKVLKIPKVKLESQLNELLEALCMRREKIHNWGYLD